MNRDPRLEEILKDPLFEMESIQMGDIQIIKNCHPCLEERNEKYQAFIYNEDKPIISDNDLWKVLWRVFN